MNQEHDWKKLSLETKVVAAGRPTKESDGALNPPIALNSTFHAGGPIGYGRYGNETWSALEEAISVLEGGKTLIFSSGMGAISSVFSLLSEGAVIVAAHNGYQGTTTMLKKMNEVERLKVRFVDLADTDAVLAAIPGAAMVYLESPTNPAIEVVDLPKIISANGPLTFCSGDSVVLSVPLLTNVTYLWKFNNNNIINGYANQLIVRQSGTYSVSIQDIFGCASNSIPVVVTVNNNPLVNLTPLNAIVCEGASVNLTATSNIIGTYTWFLNNQITPSIVGASPSVSLPGSYKVQVTSAANCKGMSNSVTVQTVPLPTVQLPKVIKLTYGEEIKVTAITTNADKIAWSPTNVVSCINCFTTIIAPTVTTTITATVFNNLNCSSYDTMLVIVSCDPKFLFIPNLFSWSCKAPVITSLIEGLGCLTLTHSVVNSFGSTPQNFLLYGIMK